MHDKLTTLLSQAGGKIEKIYICPHGPDDGCDCRKPKTGLLEQILNDYPVDPATVVLIGDSLKDLQVARAANMTPMLVRTGKGIRTEASLKKEEFQQYSDVPVFDNLAKAVDSFLQVKEK